MDLKIYKDINDFYDFNKITLEHIDSLRIAFKELLLSNKYNLLLKNLLVFKSKQEIIFLDTLYDLILDLSNLYNIHPVVKNLIIFFYMSKEYKERDVRTFFDVFLNKYMGFYLRHDFIFKLDRNCLEDFILNSLDVLVNSINTTIDFLIDTFNKHHFDCKFLEKEYTETFSVFDMIDYKDKKILNICSGNACGIHLIDCKITCLDLNKYMGINLLNKMGICDFIECNIYDKIFESLSSIFNIWIGIHTCRNLSIRIVETFIKCASESSILYLVPCCLLGKKKYKSLLGEFVFNRIFKNYYVPIKNHKLRQHCYPAMHFEYLLSLCIDYKFKIKTLRNMKSEKNKVLIVYR